MYLSDPVSLRSRMLNLRFWRDDRFASKAAFALSANGQAVVLLDAGGIYHWDICSADGINTPIRASLS